MSKKILSVVLALVLVMSTFVTFAFAAGVPYEEIDATTGLSEYTQIWSLSEPVKTEDGKYTVDVSLTTNYPTGAIQFVIEETDANNVIALDTDNVILGSAIPATYGAEISADADTGKVIIVPQTTNDTAIVEAKAISGVIATLTYTYTGTGSAQIAIKNDPKTEANAAGSLIALRMEENNIVATNGIAGQSVVNAEGVAVTDALITPVKFGAAAPTLAVKQGTNGVINTSKTVVDSYNNIACTGYIYGVEPGNALNTVFEVVGDGTMEVVASGSKECATGTKVNVLDLNGNVVESYVFILFGDVTGDGNINTIDAGDIELHDAGMWGYNLETEEDVYGYEGTFPEYLIFAADVNGNGVTNTIDAGDVSLHDAGMYGYNLETEEDIYGLEGSMTQAYVISLLK